MSEFFRKSPPPNTAPYRKTPVFDADSVPAGLLADHSTKAGVWAVVHVLSGAVTFRLTSPAAERVLQAGDKLACSPEARHSVSLSDDAEFQIEFWR